MEVVAIWLLDVIGSTGQSSPDSLEVEEGAIYIASGNRSQGSLEASVNKGLLEDKVQVRRRSLKVEVSELWRLLEVDIKVLWRSQEEEVEVILMLLKVEVHVLFEGLR